VKHRSIGDGVANTAKAESQDSGPYRTKPRACA